MEIIQLLRSIDENAIAALALIPALIRYMSLKKTDRTLRVLQSFLLFGSVVIGHYAMTALDVSHPGYVTNLILGGTISISLLGISFIGSFTRTMKIN